MSFRHPIELIWLAAIPLAVFATLTARTTASASAVPWGPVCARAIALRTSDMSCVGGATREAWSENVITATR